ncbi:DNA-dependent metalloprotease WSS1 [Hypsizygus marmoreus]|uniref:DNA-dependent metalloprotease WSS1 n=1 Tax=Hypsizygus marmoreus TaxID=39966 RepID=A0A369JW46_HYPMA|nr:DNA-dependent metalloprotease WSS1 [Hypsizygus marmoreus]
MVHLRINEKEPNPNPHINFVVALPADDGTERESARQLLRALAAQVRPIMKSHGFAVNSFEEYEHNNVFAGRNWNAGETVELVLRRPDRTFLPTFWLMSTLCHELAHIKHMHHGPSFQVLWRQLRAEVRTLQDKGYYGDGYWSSGTRLADSSRVAGQGIEPGDIPEYMCGGAQNRQRPTAKRQRRPRKPRDTTITASNTTGRQTAKRRKAGARVTSKTAFAGEGMSLAEEGKGKGKGTGFGKQAASKRAREERALATERRLLALQGQAKASTSQETLDSESETESDDEDIVEIIPETDSDRRKTLLSSETNEYLPDLKSGSLWESFERDFDFNASRGEATHEDTSQGCDLPSQAGTTGTNPQAHNGKQNATYPDGADVVGASSADAGEIPSTARPIGIGKLAQTEITVRKKEALGMAPVKASSHTGLASFAHFITIQGVSLALLVQHLVEKRLGAKRLEAWRVFFGTGQKLLVGLFLDQALGD